MLLSGCQDDIVPPSTEQAINSTQKSALWFKNANNPYETLVGDNIIAAIDSANSRGLSSTCSANNEEDAIIEWFDVVSNVYHDAVTYPIDTSLIVITSAERDYLDQITMELYSDNDLNNILNRLILIEDDLVNAYATKYPSRSKELESMLHLTSTIKHLRYGYAQIGIKPCPKLKFFSTSAIVSWAKRDKFDDCMRNKINSAGPLEIFINCGAGPGGWVLVSTADCIASSLSY